MGNLTESCYQSPGKEQSLQYALLKQSLSASRLGISSRGWSLSWNVFSAFLDNQEPLLLTGSGFHHLCGS